MLKVFKICEVFQFRPEGWIYGIDYMLFQLLSKLTIAHYVAKLLFQI